MEHQLTTLDNGLRIITHDMPSVHSAAIGCWVDTGSRDEHGAEAGASHFLEHLLFKGSDRISARQISETFDGIGARHNAFTSKEYTCFWTRLRDEDLSTGINILGEMLQRPAFRQEEIDSERHVVLEEINMNEDDPTDVAHEQFIEALWESHALAPPILGTVDSITQMSRETIDTYWGRRYSPHSTVVAVAGNLPNDIVAQIEDQFGAWQGPEITRTLSTPTTHASVRVRTKETEQAHIVFGSHSIVRSDDRRFALTLVDHVLGGGMSSRLFHEIRETRGLAYAVHSFRLPFSDAGASAIYVGTTPSQSEEVLKIIREQIALIAENGLTDEELARAKGHIKGALAIGLEDANSWMNRIGRTELTRLEHMTVTETVDRIAAVTNEEIIDVAQAAYEGPFVIGAVAPFGEDDLREFVL
ncbi:MAG: M16 family metallopeptidase [Acidimicrobiia bacterium]